MPENNNNQMVIRRRKHSNQNRKNDEEKKVLIERKSPRETPYIPFASLPQSQQYAIMVDAMRI